MSIVVKKAKNQIIEAIDKAFMTAIEKGLLPEGEHAPIAIEVPADPPTASIHPMRLWLRPVFSGCRP